MLLAIDPGSPGFPWPIISMPELMVVGPVYVLSETSLTLAVGVLATVIPPPPEMMSKNDLFDPRLNLRVAPGLIATDEGLARVPGRRPFEPARPSSRVPPRMLVPPVQLAL